MTDGKNSVIMSDLLSIIVPIYNASQYLNRCIESILAQTYKNLEIILINDGSTDHSLKICYEYQKTDRRIKVIDQENSGSVKARKAGLTCAKGVYIGFVDADDYIESNMFEMLYRKMKETDVDFVHSGMILGGRKICDYKEEIIDFTRQERDVYIHDNVFMKQTILYNLWSKLFKANLIKKAYMLLPEEQCYGEDLLCMCNYIYKTNRFYMLKDAFYHYQIYEDSLSHLHWLDTCVEESKLYAHIIKILKEKKISSHCYDSARYRYKRRILSAMTDDKSSGIRVLRYIFDDTDILKGKRIALYGAGKVGKDFYYQFSQDKQCEIVAWADKEKYGVSNLLSICQPDALKDIEYDVIVLAVKNREVAEEMRRELLKNNICKNNSVILWKEPVCLW